MTGAEPVEAQSIATNGVEAVTPWAEAQKRLAEVEKYWQATVRPDGRPHLIPHFAVWLEGALYFTANNDTRKARNLAQNPRCVIAGAAEGLDLIVEGSATRVTDAATLRRVAEAYANKYGWQLTMRNGAYDAPFGAPSAGLPPYDLYELRPETAFGLGTSEPYGATRWRFQTGHE